MINAKALFQLLSLGPGRTLKRQASLLAYLGHGQRKAVPVGPRDIENGHLESRVPLSVTRCRSPKTKSEILLK